MNAIVWRRANDAGGRGGDLVGDLLGERMGETQWTATRVRCAGRGLLVWVVLVCCWACPALPAGAQQFYPEHPEVEKLVAKGVEYLEQHGEGENRLGGVALIGLAMHKTGRPATHPMIVRAVDACRQAGRQLNDEYSLDNYPNEAIYNLGLATIFLCELDATKYRTEITRLMTWILKVQKRAGGWGYPDTHADGALYGDTSMTQYVALACWTARRSGAMQIPDEAIRDMCRWLVRTQDPSGAWGYQGRYAETYQRVPQEEVRLSLVAAALGSVYVCGDLLGLNLKGGRVVQELPPALRRVDDEANRRGAGGTGEMPVQLVRKAVGDGTEYLTSNFRIDPDEWTHYYLYALERAQSFAEWSTGKYDDKTNWYDRGVKYLQQTQSKDGSWISQAGTEVDTAFAVLFLVRSTRRSIEKAAASYDGLLRGGRGLPTTTSDVQVQGGRVLRSELKMQADALLDILETAEVSGNDLLAAEYRIQLSDIPSVRAGQLRRLGEQLRGPSHIKRLAALQVLVSERNLDSVPDLIYALTDPDVEIRTAAEEGLRSLSRRPYNSAAPGQVNAGVSPAGAAPASAAPSRSNSATSDDPRGAAVNSDPAERRRVVMEWIAWYQTVRPGWEPTSELTARQ